MKKKLLLCAIGLFGLAGLPSYGASVETKGFLKYEVYFGALRGAPAPSSNLNDMYADPNFPNTPDLISYTKGFTGRGVFPDDTHEEYGLRVTGFLTPIVSGDYNFYIRSDDASQFWISSDASEANLSVVAEEFSCCNPFQEPGMGSQTTGTPIPLVAGQKYAIQVLLKEGTGGDWFEVAWQLASGTTPAAQLTPLQSAMLSSVADSTGGTVTITQQPADATTAENVPVSFTVAATAVTPYSQYTAGGTPTMGGQPPLGTAAPVTPFYQWFTNGVEVVGANGTTYSIPWPKKAQNGLKVKCYVAVPGVPVETREATLTVTDDTIAPTVVSALSDTTFTNLVIKFSEPVSDSALSAARYAIDQGVSIAGVGRVDLFTVRVQTSKLPENRQFALTINGVQDTATPANTIAANTQVAFRSYGFELGYALHKKYLNFGDGNAGNAQPLNLFNDARYPNDPDRQELVTRFEYPANGVYRDQTTEPDGAANRLYFDTVEGFFMPQTTGDYVFYIAGADSVWLYLSENEDPANKHLIAQFAGWTNPREWLRPQANNPGENDALTNNMRSDYFVATQWPELDGVNGGAKITLQAGKKYYLELIHHDASWSGADDFAATFTLAGAQPPAVGSAPTLAGNLIGTYLDPTGASVTFATQPADASALVGRTATFTATAVGQSVYGTNVNYQWQTAPAGSTTFTNIPGATGTSYTTAGVAAADNGRQYQVVASLPGFTQASRVAVLTVQTDTSAPQLVAASAIASETGTTFDVGVSFTEALDPASAQTAANYTVSGGTVTAAKYYAQSPGVVLTVSGLTAGGSYTVTVTNVADPFGNRLTSASLPFTISSMKWGVVGDSELNLGNGVLAVAPNSFDVYSDGLTEWAAYDEATFVYEEITGDFDKEVRVEYQDPSSQWARAGLIARDVPNFGVNRATQAGSNSSSPPYDGQAGRYQKVHVNPATTAMGTAGNNQYEGNRRLETGSQTSSAGGGGTPAYPNAWARLQRVGQTFNIFRSNDGVTWTSIGSTTWGNTNAAMPAKMYVGMDYSPELGNVTPESLRKVSVAKFREYRTHSDVLPAPTMTYEQTATGLTITFEGTLQSSDTLANGSWSDVTSTSPYAVPTSGDKKFYRAKR